MKRLTVLTALSMLAACGNASEPAATQSPNLEVAAAPSAAEPATAPMPEPVALSDADKGRVCRAAIASLNGRDPAIIRVILAQADINRVRYTRDDGTVWTNECRVADNGTAEWRMVQNGQPGRWRNEDMIRYAVDGASINIQTFMGGEPITNDTYTVE